MTKKPLRVLVLVHETLVPPDSTDGLLGPGRSTSGAPSTT